MSEAQDDSDPASGSESRRKRIRQACLACRRKKVRCGGEKPVCGFCSRLSQLCVYAVDGRSGHRTPGVSICAAPEENPVASRLAVIEHQISKLQESVERLVPPPASGAIPAPASWIQPNLVHLDQVTSSDQQPGVDTGDLTPARYSRDEIPQLQTLLFAADVYFRFCHNQPYSLFHEATFRRCLAQRELPNYLVWAFLSAARRYSNLSIAHGGSGDDALMYASKAWGCIDLPWDASSSPDEALRICQAIVLIVGTENPAGLCSQAYMKLGFAIRLALDSKLHIEAPDTMPLIAREERKRTFWSLYLQDKFISLTRGRFCVIRDEECRVSLPSSEQAFRESRPEQTPMLHELTGDLINQDAADSCCPLALIPVMASTLGRVSHHVLHETKDPLVLLPWSPTAPFAALSSALVQAEHFFGMNEDPAQGLAQRCMIDGGIDQHLAGSFIFSKALFHLSHCLLHHPFLIQQRLQLLNQKAPSSFMRSAWEKCRTHAKSITSLRGMKNHNVLILTSLYGYCTMVAGTIHALSINDNLAVVREEGQIHYSSALESLRDLSCYWGHAALMVKRLDRFYSLCKIRASKLTPCTPNKDRTPGDIKALWQSVDYSSLATPTRPSSPDRIENVTGDVIWTSPVNLLDIADFENFGQDFGALGGILCFNAGMTLDEGINGTLTS